MKIAGESDVVSHRWIATGVGLLAAGIMLAARRDAESNAADPLWIARRYDRLADAYDLLVAPYDWIDGRRLARRGVAQLRLEPGDTAIALGTGTGWALPLLAEAVGSAGRVVGIDLSEGMLRKARARVVRAGVSNWVELVVGDMREAQLPPDTAGVLAAFSAEMVTDHQQLVEHLLRQLPPGARLAFSGLREPRGWPDWLVRVGVEANRIFGTRQMHRDMTPWRPILDLLDDATYEEDFGGAVYLAVGTVPGSA